jgi:sulfonate transport system permease protein
MSFANTRSLAPALRQQPKLDSVTRENRSAQPSWRTQALGLLFPVSVLLLWQIAAQRRWVSDVFLPLPAKTLAAFVTMVVHQNFAYDLFASISVVGQAFLYGTLAGVAFGTAAGLSRTVERVFGPTLDAIRHIPGIAWLPLIVLWIGIGSPAKIVVIAKSVFFPVFLNTLQGIRGVDKSYIELGAVLKLTRAQLVRKIVLPGAMPSILVGVRYGASLAWALVVVAEGLSGMEGVGFLIFRAQSLLLTDQLLVCMVVIGVIGFLIDRSMHVLQRRLLRWKQGFAG